MSNKPLNDKNKVIIACAGSGKTTYLVEEAIKFRDQKLLLTTYTNENLQQIEDFFIARLGCVPSNITIRSWYTFLLQEGVRPYHNHMSNGRRIRSIFFQAKTTPYHKKDNYLTPLNDIYNNKVAEFVFECNKKSGSLVLKRLESIYDHIFIDELQDFAGYDLNVLEMLLESKINLIAVGDPRQGTFSTNHASKNRQYRKSNIFVWIKGKEEKQLIAIEKKNDCYRCNQQICDFADNIFPELPKTKSFNTSVTGHDGVFCVQRQEAREYIEKYRPTILRYNKNADTMGFSAFNIGLSKGKTYDRVIIFPTKPMLKYLKTKNPIDAGDKSKLYVALTRAKYSVAFII